jgi:hypothetical protein
MSSGPGYNATREKAAIRAAGLKPTRAIEEWMDCAGWMDDLLDNMAKLPVEDDTESRWHEVA